MYLIFLLRIVFWCIIGPIILFILILIIINIMQSKLPKYLPVFLQNWNFLPIYLRSLEPYDKLFRCKHTNDIMDETDDLKLIQAQLSLKSLKQYPKVEITRETLKKNNFVIYKFSFIENNFKKPKRVNIKLTCRTSNLKKRSESNFGIYRLNS
jgi:hypothetical protein